jgi:hypothetical protein
LPLIYYIYELIAEDICSNSHPNPLFKSRHPNISPTRTFIRVNGEPMYSVHYLRKLEFMRGLWSKSVQFEPVALSLFVLLGMMLRMVNSERAQGRRFDRGDF